MSSWRSGKQTNTSKFYTEGQIASILKKCSVSVGGEIDSHYLIFCPFHYNTNTPACEIDKQSGLFICFSCGENGSLEDLVMRTTNRNYFEAARLIKSSENSTDISDIVNTTLDTQLEMVEFDQFTIKRLHNNLMSSDRAMRYFEFRGIRESSMTDMMLGYSDKQDMVTVPVHDPFGMCVGFVGRSIEGKAFKNSVNLPKKHILFNLHRVKFSNLTVVESSFDAIRLWQCGIPAVATLGAIPSKAQTELMSKYATRILLCPDRDEAGRKMVDKVSANCTKSDISIVEIGDVKDVGDLSDEQIKDIWKNSLNSNIIAI